MVGQDVLFAGQIGDRPGHAEDLVVGAGGEAELGESLFEQLFAGFVNLAVLSQLARAHLAVEHRAVIARRGCDEVSIRG